MMSFVFRFDREPDRLFFGMIALHRLCTARQRESDLRFTNGHQHL
jgi:hypothetical protein